MAAVFAILGSPALAAPQVTRIKVGILPHISNVVLSIAEKEGYFAEQGLDVDMISFTSSNTMIPLLIKGDLDASALGVGAGFFNAVARGGKMRLTLPLAELTVQNPPTIALLVRRADAGTRIKADPATWRGLRIAQAQSGPGSFRSYLLDRALKSAGLELKDIRLISSIDDSAQAEALKSGQVDITWASEPMLSRIKNDKDIAVLAPVEPLAPGLLTSMIAYGRRMLENQDIGTRFATAFFKAAAQLSLGKTARNVEIVAGHTGFDPASVRAMAWSTINVDGHIDLDSNALFQKWLFDEKFIDRVLEPGKFYDPRFTAAAMQILEPRR